MAGERFDDAKALCDQLCDRYPNAEYGPAHVVVSDYNFEDEFVRECRQAVDALYQSHGLWNGKKIGSGELLAVRDLMDSLLSIPEDARCLPDNGWFVEPT